MGDKIWLVGQALVSMGDLAVAVAALVTAVICSQRKLCGAAAWLFAAALGGSFLVGLLDGVLPLVPGFYRLGTELSFAFFGFTTVAGLALMVLMGIALFLMRPRVVRSPEARHG
jgi:hypothetical protein